MRLAEGSTLAVDACIRRSSGVHRHRAALQLILKAAPAKLLRHREALAHTLRRDKIDRHFEAVAEVANLVRAPRGDEHRVAEALDLSYMEKPAEPARFQTLRDYDLLPSYNRRHFEDCFSGERQGCDFELYEAHLEQRRRSNKRTYYVTVFRGVIIRITFPRKVEGVTVITRDNGWFNGLAALGRSMGGHDLKRIGLVDPKFERIFEVYGDDQVLARYMLTPSFMERLLKLEEDLRGKRVRAMFDAHSGEGELLIAAETGNLFEIGSMSKPLADQSRVQALVGELTQVLGLIDLLVRPAIAGEPSLVEDVAEGQG